MAYMRSLDVEVSRDTLAQYFITPESKALADEWLQVYPGLSRHGALRGRHMEDIVSKYIDNGVLQMINMAAGLNTFPYRHPKAKKLAHYAEFDLPNMIDFKKETIEQLTHRGMIEETSLKVKYVPTDLSTDIALSFERLGWDWSKPTIIVMEGISYYIPNDALENIVSTLRQFLIKGSPVLFDYFRPSDRETDLYKKFYETITPLGELLYTFFDQPGVKKLFQDFNIESDLLITEIERNYCSDQKTIEFASYLTVVR